MEKTGEDLDTLGHEEVDVIEGFFGLKTPEDLLKKLRHDLHQMELHPFDSYLAFNFFVTAEAMMDWIYTGNKNREKRKKTRDTNANLRITSDLATGAKHFSELADFHDTVDKTAVSAGYFPVGSFPKGSIPIGSFGNGALLVHLNEELPETGNKNISAYDLALKVLEYWEFELRSLAMNS